MAKNPEEGHSDAEGDEGGPVKSFLEHLEDLRWVLIKSSVTVFIAMLLCLISGNAVVGIIKRPLEKAQVRYASNDYVAVLMFGTNRLATYHLDKSQQEALQLSTNHFAAIYADLQPATNGTNFEIRLRLDNSPGAEKLAKQIKVDLSTLSPAGGFFVAFQVAIYGGIGWSSPFIFSVFARLVFPARELKGKLYVYPCLGFSCPLCCTGT